MTELQGYIVSNKTGVPATTIVAMAGTDGATPIDVATTIIGPMGANNNNNAYDSTNVVPNRDGSLMERLEDVRNVVEDMVSLTLQGAVTSAGGLPTTQFVSLYLAGHPANMFIGSYYAQVVRSTDGAAPIGEVHKVSDYTTATGAFTVDAPFTANVDVGDIILILHESLVMVGRNDADNAIDTGTVAANNVGSVLERQEYLQHEVESRVGQPLALDKYDGDNADDVSIASLLRYVTDNMYQYKTTTIDLNQAAGPYTLFTGTGQNLELVSLIFRCPNDVASAITLTSVTLHSDTATPHVYVSPAQGAVANLTAEAELSWYGASQINVGDLIQLTIAGGAEGAAYVCSVTAKYKAIVNGGYLT